MECHKNNHDFVNLRTYGCKQPGRQCNIMLLEPKISMFLNSIHKLLTIRIASKIDKLTDLLIRKRSNESSINESDYTVTINIMKNTARQKITCKSKNLVAGFVNNSVKLHDRLALIPY